MSLITLPPVKAAGAPASVRVVNLPPTQGVALSRISIPFFALVGFHFRNTFALILGTFLAAWVIALVPLILLILGGSLGTVLGGAL